MDITKELPVMEHFYTLQGEGSNVGKACYFIRLGGCDVGCSWCDVKESWEADKHPLLSFEQLLNFVKESNASNVVITGGEPCMYDLTAFTSFLKENNLQIWLETSGAHPIRGNFDWICVSPKKFKYPLPESLVKADELKVVVLNNHDFIWAEENAKQTKASCRLYLQPEWDKASANTGKIIDYIKANQQWTLSLQTHKYLNIP